MRRPSRDTQRGFVRALVRRRDRLAERLKTYDADGDPDRTKEELAAIKWALQVLYAAEQEKVLRDLEQTLIVGDPFAVRRS